MMAGTVNRRLGIMALYEETVYGEFSTAIGRISDVGFGLSQVGAFPHLGALEAPVVGPVEAEETFFTSFVDLQEGRRQPSSRDLTLRAYLKTEGNKAAEGNAVTLPRPYLLFLAAGMILIVTPESGPNNADGSIEASPVSTSNQQAALSGQAWIDNKITKIFKGMRAESLDINLRAGGYPMVTAALKSLYVEEDAAGFPTIGGLPPYVQHTLYSQQAAPCVIGSAVSVLQDVHILPDILRINSVDINVANELPPVDTISASEGIEAFEVVKQVITSTINIYKSAQDEGYLLDRVWRDGSRFGLSIPVGVTPQAMRFSIAGSIQNITETDLNGRAGLSIEMKNTWARDWTVGTPVVQTEPFRFQAGDIA